MAAAAGSSAEVARLALLSLAELGQIKVTSVSKHPEQLRDAPAAIYVITHKEIARSGARSLPEMLRLAPNLQVARINASQYAISARGGNLYGADKLLVLIDGRSIYTPYFSGVFWDANEVPPGNIERIEVISGPGATLWGANAVNGVINIITRAPARTQGAQLEAAGGNLRRELSAQYGGRLGDWAYRVYGDAFQRGDDALAGGDGAQDGWHKTQGGFRADRDHGADRTTLEGDIYVGTERQPSLPDEHIAGGNLLARWNRRLEDGSTLQLQGTYDRSSRSQSGNGGDFLDIYDVSAQDSVSLQARQQLVLGGELRLERDSFEDVLTRVPALYFDPAGRTLVRENVFAQDTIAAGRAFKLTLGLKLEKDAYISVQPLPSIRLAWRLTDRELLWAAVSRAIRAPSREDRDLDEAVFAGGTPSYILKGGDLQAEKLIAYETGYRAQPSTRISLSLSLFYNDYTNLRDVEPTPVTILPLMYANDMEGHSHGAELWGDYEVADWWRVSLGANMLREDFRFVPGSFGLGGIAQAGDDPGHQVFLGSSMSLHRGITLDARLREIGRLPDPAVPAYTELDLSAAWSLSPSLSISLSGRNLLHARHVEFVNLPNTVEIGRSYLLDLRWRP